MSAQRCIHLDCIKMGWYIQRKQHKQNKGCKRKKNKKNEKDQKRKRKSKRKERKKKKRSRVVSCVKRNAFSKAMKKKQKQNTNNIQTNTKHKIKPLSIASLLLPHKMFSFETIIIQYLAFSELQVPQK